MKISPLTCLQTCIPIPLFIKRHTSISTCRALDSLKLSHCLPLWRSCHIQDIIKLKQIQGLASKFLVDNTSSNYKVRLIKLHISRLMYYFQVTCRTYVLFLMKSIKLPSEHAKSNIISFSQSNTCSAPTNKLVHTYARSSTTRHLTSIKSPDYRIPYLKSGAVPQARFVRFQPDHLLWKLEKVNKNNTVYIFEIIQYIC